MLILLLLVADMTDKQVAKAVQTARVAKDTASKNIRIEAYGFAACRFAERATWHDRESMRLQMQHADQQRIAYERDRARDAFASLAKARALYKRDTETAMDCEGVVYEMLSSCMRFQAGSVSADDRCIDQKSYIAMKLAAFDFPQFSN